VTASDDSSAAKDGLATRALVLSVGGRIVLSDVSLGIGACSLVAVVGANGAGKTTLLRALAGLVTPHAGSVTLDGRALADWEPGALGRQVAYLPQDRLAHWPLAVRDIVALGRLPHAGTRGNGPAEDRAAVGAALATFDLEGLAARPVTELSGGERARVLIARAFAQEARILIADEPTAGLDPAHQLGLFERFVELTRRGGSVIVALHDLGLAARFAHRIVLLAGGRIVAAGPARDTLTEANLAAAYGVRARLAEVDGVPVVVAAARLP
jgi:iron complex transport system ATP-binding protein